MAITKPTVADIARSLRELSGGTIFKVQFVKRSTGELRTMVCRFGVGKHVNGKGSSYNPIDKGLVFVFDIQKDAWRSIPLDAIRQITIRGVDYL